jgi:hypothetical protein
MTQEFTQEQLVKLIGEAIDSDTKCKLQHKLRYLKNRDNIRAQQKEYEKAHKEERAAYHKCNNEKNKEKQQQQHQVYRETHKEQIDEWFKENDTRVKATQKRWRLTHKKERAIYHHQYVLEHKEEKRIYNHQYGLEHAEEKAIHDKLYHEENPEIWPASHERRRARILGVGGSFTAKEFRELKEAHEYTCVYCGELKTLGPDHVLPLSRGGSNNIENILPACKSCNCTKGTKTLEEFLATLTPEHVDEIQTRLYMASHPEAVAWVRAKLEENNGDS